MISTIRAFLHQTFTLLDDAGSKLFLVVFSGLFSTLFLIHYNPFNLLEITYDTALGRFFPIWSGGIFGAVILSFTQFVLRKVNAFATLSVGQYLLWIIFELVLIWLGMYLLFGESNESILMELIPILEYTVSLALIPYILACLMIAVRKLSGKNEPKASGDLNQIPFRDENGKLILSVKPDHLLLLKSESNYTSIFYLEDGKVKKELIRSNLKILESTLSYPQLIRVHRSYMVNLLKFQVRKG